MTAPTLFPDDQPDKPLPHNGTLTSMLAATTMRPFAGKQLERVFEFIQSQKDDGATDEEQQVALNMTGNSQRPRRCRLVEQGRVKESPNMRRTQSGRPAKVWVAVSPGERPAEPPQADWPTAGRTKPSATASTSTDDDSAPDMIS